MSPESGASAGQVEETHGRASLEKMGGRTPPQLHTGGVGRQQQHNMSLVLYDLLVLIRNLINELLR